MLDGTHMWEAISDIKNIQGVEDYQHHVVILTGVRALKITSKC